MVCSRIFLLLPLAVLASCHYDHLMKCTTKDFIIPEGDLRFRWPDWCEVFVGNLHLRKINMTTADFIRLQIIEGSISLINTNFIRMPPMAKLKEVVTDGNRPGVIILNNPNLQDIRGFVNWDKEVKISGNTRFPVFISGNEELDTINLPKLFHQPLSPISCEKRLAPVYNIQFAETVSLSITLIMLVFVATMFLFPMSLGSGIVYFVPGYHTTKLQ